MFSGYSSGHERKCYQLTGGAWVKQESLSTARAESKASLSCDGFLVTGVFDGSYSIKSSNVVFSGSTWQDGPPMQEGVYDHYQVSLGKTVYIIGRVVCDTYMRSYDLCCRGMD